MKRIKFKNFAGVRIKGKVPIETPGALASIGHLNRVEWLTATVESGGVFGTVQNYDGTGMTAGLHQAVACYPRAKGQGPLWRLVDTFPVGDELFEKLKERGFWLGTAGELVDLETDRSARRARIRHEFTGARNGVMPLRGPDRKRAEEWAWLFHECFSNPATFEIQKRAGKNWCLDRERQRLRFSVRCSDQSIRAAVYGGAWLQRAEMIDLGIEKDLALAVYWSHSVNAPGAAFRRLCKAVDEADPLDNPRDFAKALIRRLGKARYGRWHYTIKNGRYQRTRRAARKLWPAELFKGKGAIMPYQF